jgi:hypothetical protein
MRVRNRRKFTPEVGNTKCRSKVKVKAKGNTGGGWKTHGSRPAPPTISVPWGEQHAVSPARKFDDMTPLPPFLLALSREGPSLVFSLNLHGLSFPVSP